MYTSSSCLCCNVLVVGIFLYQDRFSLKLQLVVLFEVLYHVVEVYVICQFILCQANIAFSFHGNRGVQIAARDQMSVEHHQKVFFSFSLDLFLLDAGLTTSFLSNKHLLLLFFNINSYLWDDTFYLFSKYLYRYF